MVAAETARQGPHDQAANHSQAEACVLFIWTLACDFCIDHDGHRTKELVVTLLSTTMTSMTMMKLFMLVVVLVLVTLKDDSNDCRASSFRGLATIRIRTYLFYQFSIPFNPLSTNLLQ